MTCVAELVPEPVPEQWEVTSGVAGASARREGERRKANREARVREAHPRVGGLILALTDDPQSTKAWGIGADGEEILGRRLDGLVGDSLLVLHDRRIPRSKANIDHIVVCASGVFIVDAKKYRGGPTLGVEGGLFRPRVEKLMVGSRDRTALVDGAIKQVELVRSALAAAGFNDVPVTGMLCFIEADWPLFGGAFVVNGVYVVFPRRAAEILKKPGALDAETVRQIHRILATVFAPA